MNHLIYKTGALLMMLSFYGCLLPEGTTRGASGSGDSATSDVATNLETISNGFTPDSLETKASAALSALTKNVGDDPCADAADLYDCQPILLRMYIDMAQQFLDMTKTIVSEIGSGLGSLSDGSSGTETLEGQTVHYSKESASHFSLLLEGTGGSAAYFDVNETVYTLKMDLDKLEEAGDASGKLEIVVTYEGEKSWSIVIFISGMDCDSSDPRAPERIHIRVARTEDFWKGKAMFYNGRWKADNVSCSTSESDALAINFYTDFVANDVAAKASVYLLPRTKSDLSDIEDFGMDRFPINFSTKDKTSNYKNSFCNPTSTLDAVWDNDCSSLDAAVGSADYGPATDWIVPSEFYLETTTLPESLE
ncbi:MAG: hypothetical protein HYT76_07920 [Deltaproteobacteria bacterium]|nr:hypothetical protein [Deltaproteobacteria bacterium]